MDYGKRGEILFYESTPIWKSYYWNSYWKLLLTSIICRLVGIFSLLFSSYIIYEILNGKETIDWLFPVIISLLGAITCFIYSEYVYAVYGPRARPIKVFSNGILLPPVYFQHLMGHKGLIARFEVESCRLIRNEYYRDPESESVETVWRNGPVRMEIHLSNGKVKRTSIKPPTVIMDMAKVIREGWGIPVVDDGEGTGTVERVVDGKVFDKRRI